MEIYRGSERYKTATFTKSTLDELYRAQDMLYLGVTNKQSESYIESRLSSITVSGLALLVIKRVTQSTHVGLLAGFAHSGWSWLSSYENNLLLDTLNNGKNTIGGLAEFMANNPQYSQIQAEFPVIEYDLKDGSKVQVIQGNHENNNPEAAYRITAVLTSNGWIYS